MTPTEQHWLEAGDPTFLGWFISLIYLLAAIFALRAWWICRAGARAQQAGQTSDADMHRLATWWLGVGVLMILLGLNKELDLLQKLLREWGKTAAISQGWYPNRVMVQHAFIALLALLLGGAGAIALHYVRGFISRIASAMVGVALVLTYALLRAAIFNGLRETMPALLITFEWLLEPAGILLVIWCATRASRTDTQASRR
ncbi:MAG: hypothetical protein ABI645_08105 [Pseudomonadota bacterium]